MNWPDAVLRICIVLIIAFALVIMTIGEWPW
jgi:hypothetical protein